MWIIPIFVVASFNHFAASQCTFPAALIGTWTSSSDGTWIVNSTAIANYDVTGLSNGINTLDFVCHENQGTRYVLKSELYEPFVGFHDNAYTCLDIQEVVTDKYIYYKVSERDPVIGQFVIGSGPFADICKLTNYVQPYSYHLALKDGTETSALITCPTNLFATFTYNTCVDAGSTSTSMTVCDTRQQLVYDYTLCSTPQMFSQEGILDCVYYETSGTITYLTVYNRDTAAPDGVSYYRFTCLAIEESGTDVLVTANPEECNDNQQATTIASPGQAITFTPTVFCPITTTTTTVSTTTTTATSTGVSGGEEVEEEESAPIGLIIGGALGGLALLALLALLVLCCCLLKRRRRQKVDEEAPIADDADQSSQRSGSRRGSDGDKDDDEQGSIDSGIVDPQTPGRSCYKGDTQQEDLMVSVGDREFDDKASRPRTGKTESRMSDLPPSTLPPDDLPTTDRTEQVKEDTLQETCDEDDPGSEEEKNPKATLLEQNPKETLLEQEEKTDKDFEPEQSLQDQPPILIEQGEPKVTETDKEHGQEQPDTIKLREEDAEADSEHEQGQQESIKGGDADTEDKVDCGKGDDQEERKDDDKKSDDERRRLAEGEESEAEGQRQDDEGSGASEEEGERRRALGDAGREGEEGDRDYTAVGKKEKAGFVPAGPLTTVLVTRADEERKRHKIRGRSKKERMRKLAKTKTKRFDQDDVEQDLDDFLSEDEDERRRVNREAPFLQQYRHKKRIEHVLEDEHYWSDPDEDKDSLAMPDEFEVSSSDEASDEDVCDEDDVFYPGSPDNNRELKGRGSPEEAMAREENADGSKPIPDQDGKDSQTSNAYQGSRPPSAEGMDYQTDQVKAKDGKDVDEEQQRQKDIELLTGDKDREERDRQPKKAAGTTLIHVKEQDEKDITKGKDKKTDHDESGLKRTKLRHRRIYSSGSLSEPSSAEEGAKISDIDSGVEEEDIMDVILTAEQQELLIDSLFDENGVLRPEFDTDDQGRIIRRLDDSVIFDPATGRFTFRKKLGQLFKVPRLKRNKEGRPTGGYIHDEYGPPINGANQDGDKINGEQSGELHEHPYGKDDDDLKRSRGESRAVGFAIPDEQPAEQEEDDLKRKDGRDITSAIRRKLHSRLFRKKRKRGSQKPPLPEVQLKRAWAADMSGSNNTGHQSMFGSQDAQSNLGLNPVLTRRSRPGPAYGVHTRDMTPATQRRQASMNPEQMQMYRDGLESDRKILGSLQTKDGGKTRPFEPREAFVELEGESSTDPKEPQTDENGNRLEDGRPPMIRGNTYWSEDGRLIVRERGCPELQRERLFTVVRRREDLEREMEEPTSSHYHRHRPAPLSAPSPRTDRHSPDPSAGQGPNKGSNNSLGSNSGTGSHLTGIDDNRLRRLLEELYRDKVYFDQYVQKTEAKSEATLQSKGLAEHGRDYLLERAEFWDHRGTLPPRPPQTEVGWKMHRQQTMLESVRDSQSGSTDTLTPDHRPFTVPGVVDSPRGSHGSNMNINESYV